MLALTLRVDTFISKVLSTSFRRMDKFNKLRLLCNMLVNIIYIVESKSNKRPPIEMCFAK